MQVLVGGLDNEWHRDREIEKPDVISSCLLAFNK